MYLFVYSFLLLATMGIYTNLYLLQASQIWSRQQAIGELFYQWHASAYTMAKELHSNITPPCWLSPTQFDASIPLCGRVLQAPIGTPSTLYNSRHYLPPGYKYYTTAPALYSLNIFPSLTYMDTNSVRYLFTYIPKESEGGTAWYGYTANEIYKQIQKLGASRISYGKVYDGYCNGVNGYWIMTGVFQDGEQVCFPAYNVTGVYTIPEGSVGFISIL